MTGYLSRIARQSGLRFSSGGAVLPYRPGGPRTGHPSGPLEREEFLIIPPSAAMKNSQAGASKRCATSEQPARENSARIPARKQSTAIAGVERAGNPSASGKTASAAAAEIQHVAPEPESSGEIQALSSDQNPVPAASQAAPVELEESVTVEPGAKSGRLEKHSPHSVGDVPNGTTVPGKPYFTKTEKIIRGRVAAPAEVQTILLHEIQEWAAGESTADATQGTADDKFVESVTFSSEAVETETFERIPEPEAGVLRIGEKRLPATVPQEDPTIDQQSFDLSIGTITVVVEGDQRPPQPAPAPSAGGRREGQDTKRRRSRLGRNYL